MAFSSPGWKSTGPQSAGQVSLPAPDTLKGRPDFGEQKAKKQEKNKVVRVPQRGAFPPALHMIIPFISGEGPAKIAP
jgi:hypothetical protein